MDEAVGTAVVCPPDVEEYGIRHGIPEFAKATWYAGYQQGMKDTLAAADAARAVGDEEVVHQIARWHFNMDWPNENFSRVEEVQPDRFASYIDKGKIGLFALRAAGLKVVRG